MTPLIDGDLICYEVGFSSQKKEVNPETGEEEVVPASWDFVQDLVDKRVALICDEVRATTPPKIYLTNTHYVNKLLNKRRKFTEEKEVVYVDNFRNEVAKEKAYKAGRKREKPFHFKNIVNYLLSHYNAIVNENGLEADDQICIEQYSAYKNGELNTIICSRDKDLRQCPGWTFAWEMGNQASI